MQPQDTESDAMLSTPKSIEQSVKTIRFKETATETQIKMLLGI